MVLIVKIPNDGSVVLEPSEVQTVRNVKDKITDLRGIPYEAQGIFRAGRKLEDEELIDCDDCLVQELELNFALLGGGKKKKKKVYKKPKKAKHKKKKVKLAVLKFYKVGDDGTVQRLKRQCASCGPGTMMAAHFNRDYCGRCHLTIRKKKAE